MMVAVIEQRTLDGDSLSLLPNEVQRILNNSKLLPVHPSDITHLAVPLIDLPLRYSIGLKRLFILR